MAAWMPPVPDPFKVDCPLCGVAAGSQCVMLKDRFKAAKEQRPISTTHPGRIAKAKAELGKSAPPPRPIPRRARPTPKCASIHPERTAKNERTHKSLSLLPDDPANKPPRPYCKAQGCMFRAAPRDNLCLKCREESRRKVWSCVGCGKQNVSNVAKRLCHGCSGGSWSGPARTARATGFGRCECCGRVGVLVGEDEDLEQVGIFRNALCRDCTDKPGKAEREILVSCSSPCFSDRLAAGAKMLGLEN